VQQKKLQLQQEIQKAEGASNGCFPHVLLISVTAEKQTLQSKIQENAKQIEKVREEIANVQKDQAKNKEEVRSH
jgi:dynactin complex subunit